MSSSDSFTLTSDWDVVESIDESPETKPEETASEDLKEKESVQKGSCVRDVSEKEIKSLEGGSIVTDLAGSEIGNPQESSSSEFDVIEETVEDSQSSLSFSHMEYSISSSLDSSHPSAAPEARVEEVEPLDETPYSGMSREFTINVHPYLAITAAVLAVIALFLATAPLTSVRQIKERVSELETENDGLKSMVQSKLESDKFLVALEQQIKSLKGENFKLSDSMKALVVQLEEQTAILKKDKEAKVVDPYRSEIEKLKEQINILQTDNEELQKQLVRTRYGIYSPHSEEPRANPQVEDKQESQDRPDHKENRENSSEILLEEINELKRKLYSEVEKLKNWKDSVQHIVKKLSNGYTESDAESEKQSFDGKESSSEKERSKKPKPHKNDKKFSDWSWKGMKKNLKDTFEGLQQIDVPNMFSNYVDKKKIEGVFESVGHYFKKAQEKTKKVLKFNDHVNQEMWHFFGQLRNQWHDMKDKFFEKNYPSKQAPHSPEDRKSQFSKRKHDVGDFEAEEKFDRHQRQTKPDETASADQSDQHMYPNIVNPDSEKNDMAPESQEKTGGNSWLFKRAAHRSQLREEEQEAFTNWFLKRGRDFHYNEVESLKEWLKETYQNDNFDEE